MQQTLRIGTRGSALATTQTRQVAELVAERSGMGHELVVIRTEGRRAGVTSVTYTTAASASPSCTLRATWRTFGSSLTTFFRAWAEKSWP